MSSQREIDELILELFERRNERVVAYTNTFENVYPGDVADDVWTDMKEAQSDVLRICERMGLVRLNFERWTEDYPNESVPDGGDYVVSLTGPGMERAIFVRKPLWAKAWAQIFANFWVIATAVIVAYILDVLELNK